MHYIGRLIFVVVSYSSLLIAIVRIYALFARLSTSRLRRDAENECPDATSASARSEGVRSLHDFQYKAVQPIKYRPFESKRHVAMGMLCLRQL